MSACGRLKSSAIFDTPSIERKGLFLFPLNMNMSSYWSSLIHLMRKKTKVMICGKEHSTLEKKNIDCFDQWNTLQMVLLCQFQILTP